MTSVRVGKFVTAQPVATKHFNPEDLPMREVEFAREYKLSPEDYCVLKEEIYRVIADDVSSETLKKAHMDADVRDRVRKEVTPQLEDIIRDRITPKLREKIRDELRPQIESEIRQEVQKKWGEDFPTDSDKEAYAAAFRDIEIECMTYAAAISSDADSMRASGARTNWLRRTALFTLVASTAPYGWYLHEHLAFAAMACLLAPVILAILWLFPWDPPKDQGVQELVSEYLTLAAQCRVARRVSVNTRVRTSLQTELSEVCSARDRLSKKYSPSVRVLDEARPTVRHRLAEDIDPEQILSQEFDERLQSSKASTR